MPTKVVLIADPGIDTAFAIALALNDPDIEVLGLIATGGNVSAEQATRNIQLLINHFDPPRWPKLGTACPTGFDINGTSLHGPDGLGGLQLPPITLHSPPAGEKVLIDLLREFPRDVTVVVLGPCTMLARAIEREPEVPRLVQQVIILGGSVSEPGNATAVAEFHFYCDPAAARLVLRSGANISLIPLDQTRKLVFSPTDLLELPAPDSSTCRFLRQIVPFGIRASSQLYGIEGFHLKDVLGIAALSLPDAVTFQSVHADVEVHGELTRGMSVFDFRPTPAAAPNVRLATSVDIIGIRDYIQKILKGIDRRNT